MILFGCLSFFVLCFKRNTVRSNTAYKAVKTETTTSVAMSGGETGLTMAAGDGGIGVVHAGGIWMGTGRMVLPGKA